MTNLQTSRTPELRVLKKAATFRTVSAFFRTRSSGVLEVWSWGIVVSFSIIFLAACSAPPPPTPPKPLTPRAKPALRVVIDPGHGGASTGAIGVNGVREKDVTLDISKRLAEMIRERMHIQVVLTRTADQAVPLEERTRIANDAQGTLFISVHTNASETRKRKGVEVYYLDNTDDEASLKLAARENGRPLNDEDQDLSFIISDVIQSAKMEESITMAHYLYDSLLWKLRLLYSQVRGNGVRKAPFSVLVGAHMPSILVEVSYIDQEVEGKRLGTAQYRKAIAEGLFAGIHRFLGRAEFLRAP